MDSREIRNVKLHFAKKLVKYNPVSAGYEKYFLSTYRKYIRIIA